MSKDNDDTPNVFKFGAVKGGKVEEDKNEIPVNDYVIVDVDHQEFYATGFLVFTPHHLAIMRDFGVGAIPVLVMPIGRVAAAEIYEDDDETT